MRLFYCHAFELLIFLLVLQALSRKLSAAYLKYIIEALYFCRSLLFVCVLL